MTTTARSLLAVFLSVFLALGVAWLIAGCSGPAFEPAFDVSGSLDSGDSGVVRDERNPLSEADSNADSGPDAQIDADSGLDVQVSADSNPQFACTPQICESSWAGPCLHNGSGGEFCCLDDRCGCGTTVNRQWACVVF
jgi:hypothetical protein